MSRLIANKFKKMEAENDTRFTLESAEFKKTESYFLNILEKGTTNIVAREEFSIDIAFINDFDF